METEPSGLPWKKLKDFWFLGVFFVFAFYLVIGLEVHQALLTYPSSWLHFF